jgi:hypothetical protein
MKYNQKIITARQVLEAISDESQELLNFIAAGENCMMW